ncbi:MAG: GTPase [Lachnospiraceae bacterium]|nr:GTPase [Lachnospiraceae bacterium]
MNNDEIPVYVFFGFMDSGKTSLIHETLFENQFSAEMDNILVICCEDGDEEYDPAELKRIGAHFVWIENREEFTGERLKELDETYHPQAVFIEFNGTWENRLLYEMDGPEDWTIVQSLCTVDGTTFEMYMLNMRQMMVEQMSRADVVIINRCDIDTPKAKFRANVKSINRPAQIVYELKDGTIDNREEELPFDISGNEIEITDADYAIWFMDCMDHPEKYDGKTVSFLGLVYNPPEKKGLLNRGTFVPGRFAMTCCVEDIQFLGMKCKYKEADKIGHKSWIHLKAKVKNELAREYRGKGPVLYPISLEQAEKPEDELVYFS